MALTTGVRKTTPIQVRTGRRNPTNRMKYFPACRVVQHRHSKYGVFRCPGFPFSNAVSTSHAANPRLRLLINCNSRREFRYLQTKTFGLGLIIYYPRFLKFTIKPLLTTSKRIFPQQVLVLSLRHPSPQQVLILKSSLLPSSSHLPRLSL